MDLNASTALLLLPRSAETAPQAGMAHSRFHDLELLQEPGSYLHSGSSPVPEESQQTQIYDPAEDYFSIMDQLSVCDPQNAKVQRMMAEKKLQAVTSTSAGRLFDSVSAMLESAANPHTRERLLSSWNLPRRDMRRNVKTEGSLTRDRKSGKSGRRFLLTKTPAICRQTHSCAAP